MEQALLGFFDAWTPFNLTSPLPPASAAVDLVEQPSHWSLAYKEGTTEVGLILGKDYAIRLMRITTPSLDSVIQPLFTTARHRLLLSAVQGEYRPLPTRPTSTLQVRMDYQRAGGLTLPHQLALASNDGTNAFVMDLTLANCQVTRR
jgi:hypothetical protein